MLPQGSIANVRETVSDAYCLFRRAGSDGLANSAAHDSCFTAGLEVAYGTASRVKTSTISAP